MAKVRNDGNQITIEITVNVQEFLNRFGIREINEMGPGPRRWIRGKIQQEFTRALAESFGPKEENKDG